MKNLTEQMKELEKTTLENLTPRVDEIIENLGTQPTAYTFTFKGFELTQFNGKIDGFNVLCSYEATDVKPIHFKFWENANGKMSSYDLERLMKQFGETHLKAFHREGYSHFSKVVDKPFKLWFVRKWSNKVETSSSTEIDILTGKLLENSTESTERRYFVNAHTYEPSKTYYHEDILNGTKTREELYQELSAVIKIV